MPNSLFPWLGGWNLPAATMPPMPGHIIPPPPAAELLVSRNLNADIARLRQEIADLERGGSGDDKVSRLLGFTPGRNNLLAQKRVQLNELLGLGPSGIPPAPANAPQFGSTIPTDRTGVEDLKIIPPR
jgi:hypothetical protein